ncbi:hypothetical protein SNE40_019188 [Patella caerulea]|uniref:PKD/REJ-like domain-containing protein n=1 Tax=Patella caerulea TaxID=87958 RepID=A0AAN8J6M7_PATCE
MVNKAPLLYFYQRHKASKRFLSGWVAISVEASGYFTFDDEGCSSCISVMNVSYPSLVGNLFVMLSNGSELDLGAVTDSQQMVALTHDDSAGPQITDIKVFLERDGQLIDVILVGTGSISSDTLYVIVGEDVSIDVTIQTQIDVVFGVDYGDSITVMENCGGPISSFKLIHTYANPGQFQLNVEASDMVSGGQSSALSIEAIYNLNGITANDNGVSDLLEPGNLLTLSVSIAAGANVPFGQTTLNVTCPTEMVTELLTITAGGMQPISCNMSLPGSYEIAVIAISPLENKHLFNRTYKVWDNLKFKFVPTGEAFAIGFKPTFTLENAPVYNFDYILDFGEGTIVEKNGTDHLMTLFETIEIPVLNYNEPGNYTMHVVGSNPEYTIVQDISFIFEHAIPPSHIKHDITGMLLCPPGDVLFSIYANNGIAEPLPTDVSCTFDFGDGTVESEARVNLSYDSVGLGKQVEHIYTTEDIMNILFVCSNRVSNISITSVIDARIMNVNIIEVTHYEFLLMNDTNPVDLEITYAVINFTSPPPNLTHAISWDIAETLVEVDMTQLNDIHTYSSRDAFLVSIFFEYYSVERTESKYVKVGGVNFFLDPSSSRIGQTNTTSINFQLVRYLVSENHVVAVDWGDGSSPTDLTYGPTAVTPQTVPVFPTGVTSTISHIFIKRGVFNPVVTYTSVRGMEIYHMNDTVYIENEIKDLQIATEETYTFADDIIPIITMGNFSDPVRNISCSFNYTEGSVTEMGDLSNDTSSITTIINYSELGDKVLWVTCSNYLSEQVLNASYLVFSICFDSSSLFDRTYRTPAMALKIYTSLPQVITGRASLTDVCKNRTNIVYTWTAEKVNGSRLDEIVIAPPNSISFLILNFLSEPAIYKLTLNISFPGYPEDYIKDYMFVELIDPPLVGLINYGSERSVSIGMPVDLDAATQSHDPRVGFGVDDPLLRFSWNCYIITDNTTVQNYAKPLSTDTSYRSNPPCGFTLPNEGKIVGLDTSGATPNSWYLVEVTVRKDVRYVNSVQVLFMTTAGAPLIGITCKLNCLQKLLPEDITYLQSDVVCPSCTQTQLDNAVYLWSFYKHNFATGEDERQLWTPGITTARSDKEFRTGNNFFEEGGSYMVELEVDIPGKDMGQTTFRININWYPYGGTCDLLPLTGWSTVTRYQITCNDWKDEGVRFIKDAAMDVGEPVRYRVEQKTRLGSFVVYEGAEKSTPPFFLQMCDGTDGFNCRVVTYIKDLFSSEATVTNSVDVQSPIGYYLSKSINESNGTEVSEAESLSEFFLKMQEEVNVTKGFGSVFVTAQVASAFASVLNSIPLQPSSVDNLELINNNDSLATGQLILDGLRNVDPMETEVKNLLEFMILAITESIKDYDIKEDVSVSDVSVFSSSLTSAIDDPTLILETAQSAISKTAVDLSNNLLTKLNETVTIKDVMVAMGAISDLQDKIIDIGSPDMSGFLPQGTDYSNVIYDPQGDGFNPYEQQYFTELMNQRKKANAAGNIRNAQETITACQTIWENAFTIMNKATADNTIYKSDHNNFNTELMKGIIEQIVDLQKSKTDTVIGADQQGVTFNFTGITEDVKDKSSADLKACCFIYISIDKSLINGINFTDLVHQRHQSYRFSSSKN